MVLCDKCRWVCPVVVVEGMECVVIVVVLVCVVVAVGEDAGTVTEVDVVLYVVVLEDVLAVVGVECSPRYLDLDSAILTLLDILIEVTGVPLLQ